MKPTDDLIQEHKAIKVMLDIMSKIAENIKKNKGLDIGDVEKIVNFLKVFADKCHHGKEETVLFPALIEAGILEKNGPIGVMLQEHAVGRDYIKEMNDYIENCKSSEVCPDRQIADLLSKYVNLLRAHIQKEESILFPMAENVLNSAKKHYIAEQFEHIEEEVVGHGVHKQFHDLLKQLKNRYLS